MKAETIRRILIALDQLGNVLFGGNNPRETISSAVGRKAVEGRRLFIVLEALINVPFAFMGERNHCERRIERG